MSPVSTPWLRSNLPLAVLCLALTALPAASHEYSSLIRAKKFDEVERLTTARLATEPNAADALVGKVELIVAQGLEQRLDEAVKLAEQCIAAHPDKSGCHEARANDAHAKAEAAAMAVAVSGSVSLQDAQRDLLVGLGSTYAKDKRFTDSQRVFQEVQRRFPDSEWGPYGLARTLQEQGRNQDAIALFEKALNVKPGLGKKQRADAQDQLKALKG